LALPGCFFCHRGDREVFEDRNGKEGSDEKGEHPGKSEKELAISSADKNKTDYCNRDTSVHLLWLWSLQYVVEKTGQKTKPQKRRKKREKERKKGKNKLQRRL